MFEQRRSERRAGRPYVLAISNVTGLLLLLARRLRRLLLVDLLPRSLALRIDTLYDRYDPSHFLLSSNT